MASGRYSRALGSRPRAPSHATPTFSTSKGLTAGGQLNGPVGKLYQPKSVFLVIKGRLEAFLWNSGQAKSPAGLGGWGKGPDHA